MTFREFVDWCIARDVNGLWNFAGSSECINVINDVKKHKIFRERYWRKYYEQEMIDKYVNPKNNKGEIKNEKR